MKIAVIGDPSSISLHKRLRALCTEDREITVVSPFPAKTHDAIQDLPLKAIYSPPEGTLFGRTLGYITFFLRHRFDLIYVFGGNPIGWVAAFCSNAPLVVATMGYDVFLDTRSLPWFVKKNITWMQKVASRVTTLSPYMNQHLVSNGIPAERIMLDYWGIDPSWFDPIDAEDVRDQFGLHAEGPLVFSCRVMRPVYQIESILDAALRLTKTFPHLKLILSQHTPNSGYQDKIHALVREKNLQNQVIFMPEHTPDATFQKIYALCDVVVMVPLSDGMPSSLVEAWASRTPTIVSNIPNYEDAWHEHRVLKSDIDPAALASSIQRVLEDKGLAQRLTENGFAHASTHYKGLSDNGVFDDLPPQKKALSYRFVRHVWGGLLFAGYSIDFYLRACFNRPKS